MGFPGRATHYDLRDGLACGLVSSTALRSMLPGGVDCWRCRATRAFKNPETVRWRWFYAGDFRALSLKWFLTRG